MDELQIGTAALTIAGTALAAVAGLVAFGAFIGIQRRGGNWLMAMIYPLLILPMGIQAILNNRNVSNADLEIGSVGGTETGLTTWMLRVVTMLVLGICLARMVSVSQSNAPRGKTGRALFLAFLAFFITSVVINNIFGTKPTFDQRAIYPVFIFTALYFSRNKDAGVAIDAMKVSLLLFFLASCAMAVVKPQLAVQRDYAGWIPGFNIRFWGLGSNPNSIGPMALVFILLLLHKPFRNWLLQHLSLLLGLAVLFLSQSKTAWAATMICVPMLLIARMMYAPQAGGRGRSPYALRRLAIPLMLAALGIGAVLIALFYTMQADRLAAVANQQQVTSLSGRTAIWNVAVETWLRNPLFGYGTTMWDEEFRRMIGMNFAYNAHNQFMQTLSVAGVLGIIGLLAYGAMLLRYCLAANRHTGGLALAMFALLFVRCFTEAPFNLSTIFSGEMVTQTILFTLIVNKGRNPLLARMPQQPYVMPQMQLR
ncbi:O-antigen ligase [Noviherbaspirillum humi]|uniref:O-antigen ligase n=1 Tax=Noviherbaspirillum humi TaxID=1688639 RepID=A0A239GZR3_9BURK|nr:O-antigen ligase family protein [Noviherbaspirillum humi]SNS74392.1 O-antigen ligase [Noviherbaspirillum humi]